jgi:general secretion pathway protein G
MILTAVGPPLLASFWVPKISGCSRVSAARCQAEMLASVVKLYTLDVGTLPPSLDALIAPPADLPNPQNWKGPYFEKTRIPLDPWDNSYRYMVLDSFKSEFRIWSRGPDGISGTPDDIIARLP